MVQVTTVYPSAYFTPAEVTFLSCVPSDQRSLPGAAAASSSSSSSSWHPQAHSLDVKTTQSIQHLLALIQSLGAALRFPQRTCSTAQAVLLRLLLHHGANGKRMAGMLLSGGGGGGAGGQEGQQGQGQQQGQQQREALACACIALAGKLNDTNRKMRDVLLGSYKLRFPDLVRRGRVVGAGAGAGGRAASAAGRASNATMFRLGNVAEADIDSNVSVCVRARAGGANAFFRFAPPPLPSTHLVLLEWDRNRRWRWRGGDCWVWNACCWKAWDSNSELRTGFRGL
ncbi:hypothetical protein IE81DRAFT_34007 [Ceraceosorus guamensis]|uniref:Uncharacterized protein n=1 Tax=Ceraceosorus guamensis TaxID=1522189 RepID=A0A316VPQ9_9BASI|nr:hypothetical protein IE81DRAFT_34007 [Ceraceosorus guamensis]PWN39320.1 hypothetical protein IE81DRAFT_34007 [Ceraceosorus guamensis]